MKRYIILACFMFLLLTISVSAQQTQKTNKFLLTPFYRASMAQNVAHTYTLNINPPDGALVIQSAIITLQIYHSPTITYTMTANGQACNTNQFSVSTSFANAGEATLLFDCSNVINKAGKYTIAITPSKNTGVSTAWIDITYINKPTTTADVHGTEYFPGDSGKVFLQLLDDNEQPLDNIACFVSLYNPANTILVNQTLMAFVNEGLYAYDFTVPSTLGVHMVSAFCEVPNYLNATTEDDFECGGFGCGTGWYANWTTSGTVEIITNEAPLGIYQMRMSGTSVAHREFNSSVCSGLNEGYITYYAKAENMGAAEICTYSYWNGTNKIQLNNITDGNQDDFTYRFYSFNMCDLGYSENASLYVNKNTGAKKCYIDDINIFISEQFNESRFQVVRGSGEVHVNSPINQSNLTVSVNTQQIASAVWNFNGTIFSGILSQFAQYIWNYAPRNLTLYEDTTNYDKIQAMSWNATNRSLTETVDVTNYTEIESLVEAARNNLTAQEVWNYTNRSLTETAENVNYTLIESLIEDARNNITSQEIWNYTNRSLSEFDFDVVNESLIVEMVWSATNRTLTDFNFTVNTSTPINETAIAMAVWEYVERNLTTTQDVTNYTLIESLIEEARNNITAQQIWNYTNRSLTEFDFDNTNYTLIEELINATENNLSADDIWSYVNRSLTYYEDTTNYTLIGELLNITIVNNISLTVNVSEVNISNIDDVVTNVWNATDRNLTYYENFGDQTNYTLIEFLINQSANNLTASEIWQYVPRNLTYYEDVTDYNNIFNGVWNYSNRSLTDFNFTVNTNVNLSEINASELATAVWNYNGTISPTIITTLGDYTSCLIESLLSQEDGWGVNIPQCLS